MSYLVEQQERTSLSLPPQQQAQSMQLNVILPLDATGYPLTTIAQGQPVTISETSKNNSLLAAGALVGALVLAGGIGHYLGASGEAQKAQQQQVELNQIRSDVTNLCNKYPK